MTTTCVSPCVNPCVRPCVSPCVSPCANPCVSPCVSPCVNTCYEEKQFVDFLKQLMTTESQIECLKIKLALRPDFNCEDAYRIFELDGRGFLTCEDLKYGWRVTGDTFPRFGDGGILAKGQRQFLQDSNLKWMAAVCSLNKLQRCGI